MNIQDIQLDINKSPSVGKWVTIGQGDKGGTTIRATVYDNGAAAALAGMSARFEMRMPNATYFEDANCTVSGNVITYVVDESHAALYAGGGSEAYFSLHDGDTAIYSTERFHVRVARAASDGANPGRAWTNGIEEWLEDASDELDGYVASADARVGATINAANAAVEGMHSDVDGAIEDTEDVIGRAESAIDAMGDISELAVPLMSKDVRGGAKLDEHGGLVLRDEKLGIGSLVQESNGAVRGSIAELTAKGHAEQDGTPTPDSPVEIQVVRGRNLIPNVATSLTKNGITFTVNTDGSVTCNGTATATANFDVATKTSLTLVAGQTYTLTGTPSGGISSTYFMVVSDDTTITYWCYYPGITFTPNAAFVANSYRVRIVVMSGVTVSNLTFYPQLELGSTPTPYVPYGHVGMEARDPDTDGLISCTHIPLPSRGWVAGLPDGTADSLLLDGAGKVKWELDTNEVVLDGSNLPDFITSNNIAAKSIADKLNTGTTPLINFMSDHFMPGTGVGGIYSYGPTVYMKMPAAITSQAECDAFFTASPVTVLYPLATPTVESGYIDPPSIDGDCQISIPELDEVGVRYFVDSAVTELAKQWYARANSEYADRLEALEAAVADLVTA